MSHPDIGPEYHPYPPPNPQQFTYQPVPPGVRTPPPPPPPPKRFGKLKLTGLIVAGVIAVSIVGNALGQPDTVPVTPAASPSPAASSPSHVPETKEPAPRRADKPVPPPPAPEPKEDTATTLTFSQLGKALKKGWPTVLSEDPEAMACTGVLDLVNFDTGSYVGALVIDPDCDEIGDQLDFLVDVVKEDPESRYTHYVRGSNWIVAFGTKWEAKAFAKGVGSGLKARSL